MHNIILLVTKIAEDRQCSCCDARKEEEHLPCIDQGCTDEWDGLGQCVNVTKVNWVKAGLVYDLSIPNTLGQALFLYDFCSGFQSRFLDIYFLSTP